MAEPLKIEQLRSVGIEVTPAKIGGFNISGLKDTPIAWAASKEGAWLWAWGFYNARKHTYSQGEGNG